MLAMKRKLIEIRPNSKIGLWISAQLLFVPNCIIIDHV